MTDSDETKRLEALKRLREMRGKAEGKPAQLLAQPGQADAGGKGAKLRALLAKRAGGDGAAAGGAGGGGGKLRELLAARQNGGGAAAGGAGGGGGKLRELLAARQNGGGAAAGAGAAAGGGERPLLRKLLAKRMGGEGAAAPAAAGGDPEKTRAMLRERIGKLQARLDGLDKDALSDTKGTPTEG